MKTLRLRLRRWWRIVREGKHTAYLAYDPEKFDVGLPLGSVVKQAVQGPDGMILAAADLTMALRGQSIVFRRLKGPGARTLPMAQA